MFGPAGLVGQRKYVHPAESGILEIYGDFAVVGNNGVHDSRSILAGLKYIYCQGIVRDIVKRPADVGT